MAERKLDTIDLKGNQYAKVATRLKQFREDFPNSKIETAHFTLEDGVTEFTAYVWKDKTEYMSLLREVKDPIVARGSADANGSASKKMGSGDKDFEKMETVAVGRALAMLGYLSSGDVASLEEMEEFTAFKSEKRFEAMTAAIAAIEAAETMEQLREAFVKSDLMQEPSIVAAKDKRKQELSAPPPDKKEDANDGKE